MDGRSSEDLRKAMEAAGYGPVEDDLVHAHGWADQPFWHRPCDGMGFREHPNGLYFNSYFITKISPSKENVTCSRCLLLTALKAGGRVDLFKERALEKAESRAKDEQDLQSGVKSVEQLRSENNMFGDTKFILDLEHAKKVK